MLVALDGMAWSMPVVSGFVGWVTNWLAIQMSFYPVKFVGRPPFLGWQGVIPRKARKMAYICVDRILSRFDNINAIYLRLEPERIAGQIIAQALPRLEEYIDEIMYELQPVLWDNLPRLVRQRIYRWAQRNFPAHIQGLVEDFGDDFSDLVDIKLLLKTQLEENPDFMNRVFKEAGGPEIRFVIVSGGVIGIILGLVAMPWSVNAFPHWYLPAAGALVGFLTNWIALNLIFRPLHPHNLLGLKIQGLFLRRQAEISEVWSRLVAEELITVEKVAHAMLHGDQAARTRSIIQRHLRPMLDRSAVMKVMAQVAVGMAGYTELKKAMNEKAVVATGHVFHDPDFNHDRARVVAEAINEQMQALSPAEFQEVLRPAFQEEEWLLMLVGALLGAGVGAFQWLWVLLS